MMKLKRSMAVLLIAVLLFLPMSLITTSAVGITLVWPVPGYTKLNQGFHQGCAIDIGDSPGGNATVVSATSGTVTNVFKCTQQHYGQSTGSNGIKCSGFGTGVVIKGPDGRFYGYAHMQGNSVPSDIYVGAAVSAGQQIGRIGTTGNSSGNHLHFQITTGTYYNTDSNINPLNENYNYSGVEQQIPGKPILTDIKVNNNGTVTLKWTSCENTSSYSLRFYKAGETTVYKSLIGVTKNTEYTYGLPNGSYNVLITAEGDGCWTDGDKSIAFIIPHETPEAPTITSVVVNKNGSATVKWTESAGAESYTIRFYDPKSYELKKQFYCITSSTFYECELPIGTYIALVSAEGNGYWRNSNYSSEFSIPDATPEKPIITDLVNNNNGTVTIKWTVCERAVAYTLRFYRPGETERIETVMWATKDTEYTHRISDGKYAVKVTAEGDGCWRDSEMSDVFEVTTLPAVEPTTQPVVTEPSTTKPIEVTTTKPVTPPVTEAKATVEIRKPSQTEITYGDSIILHADITGNLPEGAYIEWTADNGNFTIVETSFDGTACTVTPSSSGDTVFTATVYDANGNEIGSDSQKMTAKAGFFQKIIAFFKKLFGLTKVIPEAFKF